MHDILYSPLFQTLTNCINGLGTYSDPYLDDLEMTLFQPQTRGGVLEIEGSYCVLPSSITHQQGTLQHTEVGYEPYCRVGYS
jgi:hypothetical protein